MGGEFTDECKKWWNGMAAATYIRLPPVQYGHLNRRGQLTAKRKERRSVLISNAVAFFISLTFGGMIYREIRGQAGNHRGPSPLAIP